MNNKKNAGSKNANSLTAPITIGKLHKSKET